MRIIFAILFFVTLPSTAEKQTNFQMPLPKDVAGGTNPHISEVQTFKEDTWVTQPGIRIKVPKFWHAMTSYQPTDKRFILDIFPEELKPGTHNFISVIRLANPSSHPSHTFPTKNDTTKDTLVTLNEDILRRTQVTLTSRGTTRYRIEITFLESQKNTLGNELKKIASSIELTEVKN